MRSKQLSCPIFLLICYLFGPVHLWLIGCASDDKVAKKKESNDSNKDDDHLVITDTDVGNTSPNRSTFTNSASNNPLTSHTVNVSKAEQLVEKFQSAKGKGDFENRLSAERLARKGVGQVMGTARRIADFEMSKGAGNTISDTVKLEIALAAISAKNFYVAEYYLQQLSESKIAKVKAGAFNALGVLALMDDRVPEAVLYFKEALKSSPGYKPAQLNLGFAALKGGDLEQAKHNLSDMQSDWFVQYALISVARLEGNAGRAGDLCSRVLEKEPAHKGALFNCALYELQNKGHFDKARSYANKSGKARGGDAGWDDRAFQLANQIDMEEANIKKKAAQKAAEKSKKAAPAKPATAPGGGAPPGAGK